MKKIDLDDFRLTFSTDAFCTVSIVIDSEKPSCYRHLIDIFDCAVLQVLTVELIDIQHLSVGDNQEELNQKWGITTLPAIRIYDHMYDFSELNNLGAEIKHGRIILDGNDLMEIQNSKSKEWISCMISAEEREEKYNANRHRCNIASAANPSAKSCNDDGSPF